MIKNQQAPEKAIKATDQYSVHSIFNTIQGEGPYAGHRSIFLRLAGCNLQCPMCDTEYTQGRMPYTIPVLVDTLKTLTYPIPELVVITGGEPLRQPIGPMVDALLDAGFKVQVETNGTLFTPLPFGREGFTIVCSPKTHRVHPALLPHIAALKYVATAECIDPMDGLPTHALEHPNKGKLFRPPANWTGQVYLQPVDEQDQQRNLINEHAVVASCLKHGHILCLQLHKIVGLA